MQQGVEIVEEFIRKAPDSPGVYRMLGKNHEILYIGKAKSLKKRLSSYTNFAKLVTRLQKMVMQTAKVEITITKTEAEALLLESNLIKHNQPRYNIELKDNKSFPYIAIDENHDYPRIFKHRGERRKGINYYGPYASAGDVNKAIAVLQRSFLLRPCADSVFSNRSRPCLEYQIKRCSAPCVNKVSEREYYSLVEQAKQFLKGKSRNLQERLEKEMSKASEKMEYEKAVIIRDRIRALTQIQAKQYINVGTIKDADVIAVWSKNNQSCIQVFFFRGGSSLGNKAYFPRKTEGYSDAEILEAFMGRFYQINHPPKEIIVSNKLNDPGILQQALQSLYNYKIKILFPQKGEKLKLVQLAHNNAKEALKRKIGEDATQQELLTELAEKLGMDEPPKRIEIFDNSHISGKHQVGAMVVAGPDGFIKNAYRKFSIRGTEHGAQSTGKISEQGVEEQPLVGKAVRFIAQDSNPEQGQKTNKPGDDYAMMREVLTRRYSRLKKESKEGDNNWPDLVLIDGGPGHLSVAREVFADLGLTSLPFVCIAKGPDRNAGKEKFYQPDRPPFQLEENSPVLFYLQRLRDEAHRFAIMSHRAKRSKAISKSALDDIEGIGVVRKKALLHHFGSAVAVERAGLDDLVKVEGVSKKLAQQIYDQLH